LFRPSQPTYVPLQDTFTESGDASLAAVDFVSQEFAHVHSPVALSLLSDIPLPEAAFDACNQEMSVNSFPLVGKH
jgi:hypothetical protein